MNSRAGKRVMRKGLPPRTWNLWGSPPEPEVVVNAHMRRTRASARWMRFALALALAMGLAVMSGAAQRSTILTNGRNLQIPINHGLPDKPLGFTFCRLRYQNIRRARKSGWGDDYPQADYNFMVRLSELTKTRISRWNNGDPGFANVTAMDPDLFRCPYLRMQNAANYDFTPEETARMHDYLLKGGFLWIDDNWDPDFEYIRPNLDANPARRTDRRPAGRSSDVLDSLSASTRSRRSRRSARGSVRVRILRSGLHPCTTTVCSTTTTGWWCSSA